MPCGNSRQVAWLNAQLHDHDVAELNALPDTATRLAQCAAILDGYELSSDQRVGFVDRMIEFALRRQAEDRFKLLGRLVSFQAGRDYLVSRLGRYRVALLRRP